MLTANTRFNFKSVEKKNNGDVFFRKIKGVLYAIKILATPKIGYIRKGVHLVPQYHYYAEVLF